MQLDPARFFWSVMGRVQARNTDLATQDLADPTDDSARNDGGKGINDAAAQLGVTHRALRFYEDKGLIEPARAGNTRIYSRRDIARMQLILRGKRLGFSLREIKEFLDLYDADPTQLEQMQHLVGQISARLRLLERQSAALQVTIAELQTMQQQAGERIALLNADQARRRPAR
jgi:DNA-binding transcriptional MerR regulator